MHAATSSFPLPHRLGPEALLHGALTALQSGNAGQAATYSLLCAEKYGTWRPESYALCAVALTRAGQAEDALRQWDIAVRRRPQNAAWLAQALRAAWRLEATSERAATLARQWLTLLERVFVAAPPPELLAELTARGWEGVGCAGMHRGHLRAWLWLPQGETFRVRVSQGGLSFPLGTVRKMTLGSRSLHICDAAVPATDATFFLSVTDAAGRHAQGSPLPCSSTRAARPVAVKKRVSGPTVIVPVYDDRAATLRCLASVLASRRVCATPFTLLVMWDHGPDATLFAALRRLAARGKIVLHETPANMGFLGCINRALSLVPAGDVVLLNADTLVHGDWLDRLIRAACTPDAATITALGSDAELVSFPSPDYRGDVRRLRDVRILDAACRTLPPKDALREIPVGVGFCMVLTRRALDRLDGFDGFFLFSGYGEEVDFCLRAEAVGLKNYAALNVFVAHLGGRSFGYAKKALAAQNNAALFLRYPHYDATYTKFLREDTLRPLRERISRAACRALPAGTPLELYPLSALAHPEMEAARQRGLARRGAWAALFARPCGAATRAVLRVCGDVPLADMSFVLPRDAKALCAVLARCGVTTLRACCREHIVHAVDLPLAVELAPRPDAAPVPPLSAVSGVCLAEAPRSLAVWRRFCRLAARRPGLVFWVVQCDAFWGDAPRPANVRHLPDDAHPALLRPQALLLTGGSPAVWRDWLERRGATLPLCALPAEAA